MRHGGRLLLLSLFVTFMFSACGDEGRKNCSKNGIEDCKEGEECYFAGNKGDDWYCFLPCVEESGDCPDGQSCKLGASSCQLCMDMILVCL